MISERCQRRGGKWGVRSLRLALASANESHDGKVTARDIVTALNMFGVRCAGQSEIADIIDTSTERTMISTVMDIINGPVDRVSLQLICAAYESVCTQHRHRTERTTLSNDLPTVEFVCQVAMVSRHPDVESNAVSLRDGLFCFFALWGLPQAARVSQSLFVEFHCDLLSAKSKDVVMDLLHRLYDVTPVMVMSSNNSALAPDRSASDKLFDSIDSNKNGMLSLAELDLAVIRLWPSMNDKRAIMRAYKLADSHGNSNGTLSKKEFFQFLHFLSEYSKLVKQFNAADTNRDGRVSFDELRLSKSKLGLHDVSDNEIRQIFAAMDANGGGKVLFEEFAVFMAKRRGDEAMSRVTNKF
jgi:Ca2+-binding EF-hand superfamily protein